MTELIHNPYWEVARHRMAPPMALIVDDLLATGRLVVAASHDVDPASYDPAGGSHLVTKVGIDATRKANYPLEISTPGVADIDLSDVFGEAWTRARRD